MRYITNLLLTLVVCLFVVTLGVATAQTFDDSNVNTFGSAVTGMTTNAYPADATPTYDFWKSRQLVEVDAFICNTDATNALHYKIVIQPGTNDSVTYPFIDSDGNTIVDVSLAAQTCQPVNFNRTYYRIMIYVKSAVADTHAAYSISGSGEVNK